LESEDLVVIKKVGGVRIGKFRIVDIHLDGVGAQQKQLGLATDCSSTE
jgi:hypothetical protein